MPATPKLTLDPTTGPVRVLVCDVLAPAPKADGDKPLPGRMVIMKWGENQTAKGRVVVNDTTLRVMPQIMQASNLDRIALDFDHNTVPGHPSYKGEPAKIAAMGAPLVVAGEGIVLDALSWTPEGNDHVRGGHYPDLSPVVVLDANDAVIAVTSVAACRTGATVGLGITLSTDLFINQPASQMDFKKILCLALGLAQLPTAIPVTREVCLSVLGLKPDAKDAEIEAAAQAAAPKGQDDLATQVKTLSTTVTTQTAQIEALLKRETDRERQLILSTAISEGKVVPKECSEGATALDNAQLKALVLSLPVTVPLDRRTGAPVAHASGVLELSTAEDTVRKQLGISKEDWGKHNKVA